MRILQITKKFPWPVKDGEVIGILNLTLGFAAQGHAVTTLSLNTKKHYFPPAQLPADISNRARFIGVDIDTSLNPIAAFFNLFSSKSYNIERFYSKEFEDKIASILGSEKFDLILLEGIYLMRYIDVIRKNTATKVLLRPQNVEWIIWERLCAAEKNVFKKAYLKLLAKRMKRFEIENANKADILIPVSPTDLETFRSHGSRLPATAIPTGYMFETLPAISETEETAIAFIGGMDWAPNREGVEWFINEVWPVVIAAIPEAKFYLAGRNFPEEMRKIQREGIVILGEVDDAKQFILSKPVFIVPLFAGSGMRVKIVEAMALGRAIVSTSIGAEGLEYKDGENLLVADKAPAFAEAVIKVLKSPQLRLDVGNNAQKLVLEKYDNRKICLDIISFCKPYLN